MVLALAAILAGVPSSPQTAPPDRTVIFEQEPWYRGRSEPERTWNGTLRRREVISGPNARTALRYSLITGSAAMAVYAPTEHLEPFVGATVLIRGKLVDLSAEGFGPELWPGSIARVR